jgi:C-terminal processing protease CtpA/Prc
MKRALAVVTLLLMLGSVITSAQQTESKSRDKATITAEPAEPTSNCPFLGVYQGSAGDVRAAELGIGSDNGAIVWEVIGSTSAERAGLQKMDVIVSYNGQMVAGSNELREMVLSSNPGDRVVLNVVRDGQPTEIVVEQLGSRQNCQQDVEVEVRRMPLHEGMMPDMSRLDARIQKRLEKAQQQIARARERMDSAEQRLQEFDANAPVIGQQKRMGATVQDMSPQLSTYFGLSDGRTGALVSAVTESSPSEKGGLRAGDVITAIDGEGVNGPGDLMRIIRSKEGKVTLTVIREHAEQTIVVDLGSKDLGSHPSHNVDLD